MSYANCGKQVPAVTLLGMTSLDRVGGFLVVQKVGKVQGPCIIMAGELNLSRGVSCSLAKASLEGRVPGGCVQPS